MSGPGGVCSGRGLSAQGGCLLQGGVCSGGCLVLGGMSAPGGCLVETPQKATSELRYASYWNAFLLNRFSTSSVK